MVISSQLIFRQGHLAVDLDHALLDELGEFFPELLEAPLDLDRNFQQTHGFDQEPLN